MAVQKLLVVDNASRGSEAERVGLQEGDIIVSYDSVEIRGDRKKFSSLTPKTEGKESVTLNILRNNQPVSFTLKGGILGIAVKEKSSQTGFGDGYARDFWAFRRMITPLIIQILFWIGVAGCVLSGIGEVVMGGKLDNWILIFYGIASILLGPVIVRLLCEIAVVFFRMNETLTEMKNATTVG